MADQKLDALTALPSRVASTDLLYAVRSATDYKASGSDLFAGPATATDGVPALFNGTTGLLIKNSTPTGTGNPVMDTSPTIMTPTITGALTASGTITSTANASTLSGGVWSSAATPRFVLQQTGASANQKLWDLIGISDGNLRLRAVNDADTSATTVFTVNRTTSTINSFTLDNGLLKVADTTDSASTATGSLQTLGGLGVAKAIFGGGTINITGHTTFEGVTSTGATGTGKLVYDGTPTLVTPVLGTPTSGNLSNCTADGTNTVGFRSIPQNSQSAAYTTVLADAGKHLYHPSADTTARNWTIDSNGNVPYVIGTTLTFVNDSSAGVITIKITADTLVLAGTGSTGDRTLAANGIATAIKMTSTRWQINGTGIT